MVEVGVFQGNLSKHIWQRSATLPGLVKIVLMVWRVQCQFRPRCCNWKPIQVDHFKILIIFQSSKIFSTLNLVVPKYTLKYFKQIISLQEPLNCTSLTIGAPLKCPWAPVVPTRWVAPGRTWRGRATTRRCCGCGSTSESRTPGGWKCPTGWAPGEEKRFTLNDFFRSNSWMLEDDVTICYMFL